MVEIVSFDYFPMTEYVDFGFTPTEPWSDTFEYLSYESINFIDGLGSIIIFIWIGALYLITVFIVRRFSRKKTTNKALKYKC